ncbi:MAG: DUF885 domain-containing protein, partial [Bifidobacteriaceae bacterium]|nr:DUF885 domain-containing protein [Bifidobacteriaceae bacterium]
MTSPRQPSKIDQIADEYLENCSRLVPLEATLGGVVGYDHLIDDMSPAGLSEVADLKQHTLTKLSKAVQDSLGAAALDATDQVTVAAMRERLGVDLERYEMGEWQRELNILDCPLQRCREVFDLMQTDSLEDWQVVAQRLAGVPKALQGYQAALEQGRASGKMPAARQVAIGVKQASELAVPGSFFDQLVERASAQPESLRKALGEAAKQTRAAYGQLASYLSQQLAPAAPDEDAVGRERYELASRYFVGATVDLAETYQWGLEQLRSLTAEQEKLAELIAGPGASVAQATEALNADPNRQLDGPDALQQWMTQISNQAMQALAGVHFDVPEPVRQLECMIAPTHTGAIYYTGPSENFSRPGRMWWSIPEGVTKLNTWKERTTVYHEGVPGHHLQIATTTYRAAQLNRWRRLGCWVSGHGEGWALYAERLMEQLGFLDDPGDRFGMIDSQRFRAARVVLDIGLHLGLPCPEEYGGGVWNANKGWD